MKSLALIVSLLPLGEGLGKRGLAWAEFYTNALSPTLSQRERELIGIGIWQRKN